MLLLKAVAHRLLIINTENQLMADYNCISYITCNADAGFQRGYSFKFKISFVDKYIPSSTAVGTKLYPRIGLVSPDNEVLFTILVYIHYIDAINRIPLCF